MDKREVNMLSTVHKPVVMKTKSIDYTDNRKRVIWKPECVIDYNLNMRLVDQSDAMISSIECARPTMKWYKKLFFHLVDLTTLNAHILHHEVKGTKESLPEFAKEMCREILAEHAAERTNQSSTNNSHLRQRARHFPSKLPLSNSGKTVRRRCHICFNPADGQQKYQKTSYWCAECEKPLCIDPCFRIYHTDDKPCKCCK